MHKPYPPDQFRKHGRAAQKRGYDYKRQRRRRGIHRPLVAAIAHKRGDEQRQNQYAQHRRREAMAVLQHSGDVVERRYDFAMAERPVGAAEPGAGNAHNAAERYLGKRGHEGGDRQRSECHQGSVAGCWSMRHCRKSLCLTAPQSPLALVIVILRQLGLHCRPA